MESVRNVNAHIHTPYSFSAFDTVEEAVRGAVEEHVVALGISDFNTVDGFAEFGRLCLDNRVHPLYNIEYIALSRPDKEAGVRFNDPKNPGVMYYCGKALRFRSTFSSSSAATLRSLWDGSQAQIREVIAKLNDFLASRELDVTFDYDTITSAYAQNTVRERHVAKAIFRGFALAWSGEELLLAYRRLFDDQSFDRETGDAVAMQEEIRNRLLKAGKPVFVEEKAEAFLSPERVHELIVDGGGIPCYPVLTDDSMELNERERDVDALAGYLIEHRIHAVEFIPLRNTLEHLKRCVTALRAHGFCVTFGTEHNTPKRISLVPAARGGVPLGAELSRVGYEGACILAAHQKMVEAGKVGYVDSAGNRVVGPAQMDEFARYGNEVIRGSTLN